MKFAQQCAIVAGSDFSEDHVLRSCWPAKYTYYYYYYYYKENESTLMPGVQ